jgi:F0F1-type ATP synthase alpha subunit
MTPEILEEIAQKKQISDDLKKKLASTIQKFTESFNK